MARRAQCVRFIFAQTKVYDDALSILLADDICWFEITVDDVLLKIEETSHNVTKCDSWQLPVRVHSAISE